MIEFKNVCKKYANFKALDEINLIIPSSSIFGIVGKSGAGKSTLLRTINQFGARHERYPEHGRQL